MTLKQLLIANYHCGTAYMVRPPHTKNWEVWVEPKTKYSREKMILQNVEESFAKSICLLINSPD